MFKKIQKFLIFVLLGAILLVPFSSRAFTGKVDTNYPKLANYFLNWQIPDSEVENLSKWDVLILDMEVQKNSLDKLKKIRQLNPDIIILAYVTSEELGTSPDSYWGQLRNKLLKPAQENWWLKDSNGKYVSFWPGTRMINLTDTSNGWTEFLPQFLNDQVISTGLWDGIFFDNIWPNASWLNGGDLDIDNDGKKESAKEIDSAWVEANKRLLNNMRNLLGDNYILMGNSHAFSTYQPYLNGIMLESFPASFEADGTWAGSMNSMVNIKNFKQPKIVVVNANTNNTWGINNYRQMRFSLGSALLGDGTFSFDQGANTHSEVWWYDEYNVNLGKPVSDPINILDKNNKTWKKGIWRRDFENGIVVVNSTDENKNYVFTDEAFDKINGTQDRSVNNGAKINLVSLMGQDGVILLGDLQNRKIPTAETTKPTTKPVATKTNISDLIKNSAWQNGAFYRSFNLAGTQTRDGFFAYNEKYPGNSQIIVSDIDNDKNFETLVNSSGVITIYRSNRAIKTFKPFDGKFKGAVSMAVADLDGNGKKEIVVGAGAGGGPQVRIFNSDGRLLNGGFFAYDRTFRGGVNLAVVDLNGDGTKEIITGSGAGGGPQVRIFNQDGKLLSSFFAYDKNSRGGVFVAAGNVDGQGASEIITGAGVGMLPEVRIFSQDSKLLKKFSAYDQDMRDGVMVSSADINGDGQDEILAGSLDF